MQLTVELLAEDMPSFDNQCLVVLDGVKLGGNIGTIGCAVRNDGRL